MTNAQSKTAIPKKSQTQVEWFKCSISKKELRGYMKRQNRIPLIWLAGHFSLIVIAGLAAWSSLGAWYFWPIFFVYATAYSFLECLMHETQHGTVFRTRWINEVVYYICCFYIGAEIFHQPLGAYRASHAYLYSRRRSRVSDWTSATTVEYCA